jgi:S1-C subfamily serine protease
MLPQDDSLEARHEAADVPSTETGVTLHDQPTSRVPAYDRQTTFSPMYTPPEYHSHAHTQRLSPPPPRQGVGSRAVAGIAALSLLLGGAAGAGAGLLVDHNQSNNASASQNLQQSPVSMSSHVVTADVTSLTVKVVQQVGPAVVSVLNSQQPQSGLFGATQATSAGSGIIIDANGYILTNYHVIDQAQNLKVTFANGTTATATLVGGDSSNDIAVIKVNVKVPAVAQFGDSNRVSPGETVLAIGNALGNLQNTVTEGIVSGMGRSLPNGNDPTGASLLQNLIQTDAAINHGNSGGPLVDLAGNVIGINTAVVRSTGNTNGALQSADQAEGLGFAIPSDTAKAVADRLIFHTPSPFLGVEYRAITPQVSSASGLPVGARLLLISKDSPAARAGLKANDVITAVSGQRIDDQHDLKYMLDTFHVGDTVKLTVYRGNTTLTISVALGKRPAQ